MSAKIVGFAVAFILLLIWQIFHVALPEITPNPFLTFNTLIVERDLILHHFRYTFIVSMVGLFSCLFFGLFFAATMHFSLGAKHALYWGLVTFQLFPFVILAPLALAYFDYNLVIRICFVTLLCYLQVVLKFYQKMGDINDAPFMALRSLGFSPLEIFIKLRVLTSMPYLFICFRSYLYLSFSGTILIEYLGGENGLGYVINIAGRTTNLELVFAALLIVALCNLFLFFSSKYIQTKLLPWYLPMPERRTPNKNLK